MRVDMVVFEGEYLLSTNKVVKSWRDGRHMFYTLEVESLKEVIKRGFMPVDLSTDELKEVAFIAERLEDGMVKGYICKDIEELEEELEALKKKRKNVFLEWVMALEGKEDCDKLRAELDELDAQMMDIKGMIYGGDYL